MKDSQVSVGVVIPAWNASATIDQALASIAGQELQPVQVVVVDDASTDGTADCAAAWTDLLPLEVIRLKCNSGTAVATDTGVFRLHTSCVSILDADDIWLPDHLAVTTSLVEPGVAGVADALGWVPCARLGTTSWSDAHPWPRDPLLAEATANWILNSYAMLRDDYLAVGGNGVRRRCHDHDFWLRWLNSGRTLRRASTPTLLYRQHPGSVSKGSAAMREESSVLNSFAGNATTSRVAVAAMKSSRRAYRRSLLLEAYDEARDRRSLRARILAWRSLGPPLGLTLRGMAVMIAPVRATRLYDRLRNHPKRLAWG